MTITKHDFVTKVIEALEDLHKAVVKLEMAYEAESEPGVEFDVYDFQPASMQAIVAMSIDEWVREIPKCIQDWKKV